MQVNSQKRENTQTTILALLLAHKGGCTLRQLDKEYYELEGEHIPWKDLGYVSLLSFLHSMSKSVQLEDKNNTIIVKGVASEKSKHVSKLVAGQKDQKHPIGRKIYKPSHYYPKTAPPRIHIPAEVLSRIVSLINNHPDGLQKDYVLQQVQSCMPFANVNMTDMEEQLKELSHKILQRNDKIYPVQSKVVGFNYNKKSDGISCSEFTSHKEQEWKSTVVTVAGDEDSDDVLDYNEEDIFEFVPHNYASQSLNSRPITKVKPTSSFIKETVSKCQDQLVEHKSTVQINQKDSNDLCLSNYNSDDQIAKEFNNNLRGDEEYYLNDKDVDILINERVKFRLEKLIQNHPDGIWCAELPQKYLEEYKVPLNYSELGFNSVREFAAQLPQIFHCVQLHCTSDFMLYYAKREVPSNKLREKQTVQNLTELYQIYETNNEEALPAAVSLNTCKELIPDEVMTIGECVGTLRVADLAQSKNPYVEVVVVEVFTPSFFWIQLRKKQKVFKKFMDDLHNFYTTKYEQYVIPPVVLEKGLNCACIYNGIWHRGIIKTVKPDFQVTVMFYDYGTLKTYSPDAVYYLHRIFSCLPAQAIPCGLINIRPCRGSKWSRSATHCFAVRTSQIPLIATIASINTEDNSMMVTLTDTLEEEDVHINDWLVEQKLAEHGRMVCMKKRNFPFYYYLECRERFKRKFEISKISQIETDFKNKEALYNVNPAVGLSDKNSSNKVHSNKRDTCNESSEKARFLKSIDSREKDTSIEETHNSTHNSEGRPPSKLQSLYEKLLSLKLKSTEINSKNNNNIDASAESKEYSDSSSASNRSIANIESKKTKSDSYKRESELSDNDYDILDVRNHIPVQYANHFDIQDPENELDINYMRSFVDKCNEDKAEYTDWSMVWKDAMRVKETVLKRNEFKIPHESIFKDRENIPLAENCFLSMVRNSSYYTDREEETRWSPTGNINTTHDVSPLILKDLEKRTRSMTNNMTIAVPQKILELLTEEQHSERASNTFKTINETQPIGALEKTNACTTDNFEYTDDNNTLGTPISDEHSEDCKENDYFCIKTLTSRKQLLEKLLSTNDKSSNTSDLDSDDLSTSEKSVSCQHSIHSSDRETKVQYKNNVNINASKSSESSTETDIECSSHSTQADIIDRYTQKSVDANDHELYENEITVTASETSELNRNAEVEEDVSTDPISTQKLIQELDSVKVQSLLNGPLLNDKIIEPVDAIMTDSSIDESVSSNMTIEGLHVPVFNDNSIESDEEEWDVHVSHDDLYNLLKGGCSFSKGIDDRNHPAELESHVKIVEIDDSNSLEGVNEIETYTNLEGDTYEVMHSDRVVDHDIHLNGNETENITNGYEKSEIDEVSSTNSEKSLEINNESISNAVNTISVPHKVQGKARTLVEMLNKVKLLQGSF